MLRETLAKFKERFIDNITEGGKDFRLTYDYIYNMYYERIEPYQHLITKYQNSNGITIDEICVSFAISKNTFNACRYYFKELDLLVKHKRDIMKIKSEMDLQRGISLSPTNQKLIEMEQRLYNDEWKDKGADVAVNIPSTLNISFEDASKSDKELKEEE